MDTQRAKTGNGARASAPNTVTRTLAGLPGPKGVPLFGNALQIDGSQFHLTMENWAREFGSLYRFRLGSKTLVVTSDHAVVSRLLRDRPDAIRRSSHTARIIEEGGTCGVFTAEGEEWRKQRKLIMRALTPEVVRNFFPTLASMTERLRRRWQNEIAAGRPVNVLRDLKAFTLDVTIGLAMGHDINTLEHEDNPLQRDVDYLFKTIGRRLSSPFPYWRYLKLPGDRAADRSSERIQQATAGFIAEARKRLHANPALRLKPSNLLEALVAARDEPGSGFTDNNVVGNAMTMVFSGEDTTSNSIAWLLDFIARDARVAAHIAAEADSVSAGSAVLRDFQQLEQLHYIEAANQEAMRLKPVAAFLTFETNSEIVVEGVRLPAGTTIICLLRHAIERDSGFSRPDAFIPERWLAPQTADTVDDPGSRLFPFGGGPRFCPGRYLAMVEIKMLMCMLAKNFEPVLVDDAPAVRELFTFTMTPDALPVLLRQRRPA
jgi:cytochrome P450